jgi:S-formylglutathione hydrolase FrmB
LAADTYDAWDPIALLRKRATLNKLGSKESTVAAAALPSSSSSSSPPPAILIDQGLCDQFLEAQQLQPGALVTACAAANVPLRMRMHADFDHSYFFISTFVAEHVAHHAAVLNSSSSSSNSAI